MCVCGGGDLEWRTPPLTITANTERDNYTMYTLSGCCWKNTDHIKNAVYFHENGLGFNIEKVKSDLKHQRA